MMDLVRNIFKALPLDEISERVGEVVAWWSEQVAGIPASDLPINAYIGCAIIVCLLWYFIARLLPKPLGGMSWIMVISILLTPGPSFGDTGGVAPACVGVAYSILMKNPPEAAARFVPIMMVMLGGFLLGFVWQLIREQIAIAEANKPPRPKRAFLSNPFKIPKEEPEEIPSVTPAVNTKAQQPIHNMSTQQQTNSLAEIPRLNKKHDAPVHISTEEDLSPHRLHKSNKNGISINAKDFPVHVSMKEDLSPNPSRRLSNDRDKPNVKNLKK